MKKTIWALCVAAGVAAAGGAGGSLFERLEPAAVGGGFRMEGYWVWCGSVIRGEDGRCHMFASRWPKRYPFFEGYVFYSEIVRASADRPEGPYRFELEMIAKDMTGGTTGEVHAGAHARSTDGVHWMIAEQPKAWSRTVRWSNGTVTTQGSLERPQLLFENGKPTHLFAATGDGPGGFRAAENTWTMVIPIRPD